MNPRSLHTNGTEQVDPSIATPQRVLDLGAKFIMYLRKQWIAAILPARHGPVSPFLRRSSTRSRCLGQRPRKASGFETLASNSMQVLRRPSEPAGLTIHVAVLPRRTGPFFNHWQAVLVEHDNAFIFREEQREVCEGAWPLGTFRDGVSRTKLEFFQYIPRTANSASVRRQLNSRLKSSAGDGKAIRVARPPCERNLRYL